jgi:hypothetical protein
MPHVSVSIILLPSSDNPAIIQGWLNLSIFLVALIFLAFLVTQFQQPVGPLVAVTVATNVTTSPVIFGCCVV